MRNNLIVPRALLLHVFLALVAEVESFSAEAYRRRINFIDPTGGNPSPNPAGWEAYDGSVYTKGVGHGWMSQLTGFYAGGGGEDKLIRFPEGVIKSPREAMRLELATWQGAHRENHPLVFRIDLPDGWYRVHCASLAHGDLPVVDQRNFNCRAQDAVFAGGSFGPPLKAGGRDLIEGSDIVEVKDGHLRIVVGDPAYAGWTWAYQGPWYAGWRNWWRKWGDHRYAETWYQKLTRVIDPGFHHLRINSLEVERVAAPERKFSVFFRDFFNRDDSSDINAKVAEAQHWIRVPLRTPESDRLGVKLYKTSLNIEGSTGHKGVIRLVQRQPSPSKKIIRYSTRVSLFTGEGSEMGSGIQEAGLLILGGPAETTDFNSTFIGVAYDRSQKGTPGRIRYRVGDGQMGYRTESNIPDTSLPFKITEGEHEIIVDHDLAKKTLTHIRINGIDVTDQWSASERSQRNQWGQFGIRSALDDAKSGVRLKQFYWYYRVETQKG